MARYARFIISFWDDPDLRGLQPLVKLAYVWCFTNHRCRISGMYVMDHDTAPIDTGMTPRQWKDSWRALLAHRKKGGGHLVRYDDQTGVVWVVGRFKQETRTAPGVAPSGKTITGAVREVHELPPSVLHDAFRRHYSTLLKGHPWAIDGPPSPIPIPTPSPTQKREAQRRTRSKPRRRSGGVAKAATPSPWKAITADGIDTSAKAKAHAKEVLTGLLSLCPSTGIRGKLLEMKILGVLVDKAKPQGGLAIYEHADRNEIKRAMRQDFSRRTADSILIRTPEIKK